MTKVYAPHIAIIREAITAIEQYRPAEEAIFLSTPVLQDAVLMRLQVIGEHLARMRHIDEERFAVATDDSWAQLIGLRNVISHGYDTIRRESIWLMITEELLVFAQSLDALSEQVDD